MTNLEAIEARWHNRGRDLAWSQDDTSVPWLLARVRDLEMGLTQYGQHKPRCYAAPLGISRGRHDPPCTCGLTALATE